jgi:hypothetical protein
MEVCFVTSSMGFGNLLYVYMCAHHLSKIHKRPISFHTRDHYRRQMQTYVTFNHCSYRKTYENPEEMFDLGYFDIHLKNGELTTLLGYFQSYKFYDEITLKHTRNLLLDKVKPLVTPLLPLPSSSGACRTMIHYRRGDYVGSHLFRNLDESYYLKALEFIGNDIGQLCIFSDDLTFTKTLRYLDKFNPIFVDESNPEKCFVLMMECDNFIVANSTYSLLSYELSGKTGKLVAPREWFNNISRAPKFNINDVVNIQENEYNILLI